MHLGVELLEFHRQRSGGREVGRSVGCTSSAKRQVGRFCSPCRGRRLLRFRSPSIDLTPKQAPCALGPREVAPLGPPRGPRALGTHEAPALARRALGLSSECMLGSHMGPCALGRQESVPPRRAMQIATALARSRARDGIFKPNRPCIAFLRTGSGTHAAEPPQGRFSRTSTPANMCALSRPTFG